MMTPPKVVKGLTGFAVTALFFGCVEAGSYLIRSFPIHPDPLISDGPEGWVTRVYDHLLFWRLRPNTTLGNVTVNSLGVRGPEIPSQKGDEFRVLSLGESTTFGAIRISEAVAYEDCYSAVLQDSLESVAGRPLRVINAGVPGCTLLQGYSYLRYHGFDLEPDAVLLYFGYNDFLLVGYLRERDANAQMEQVPINDWTLLQKRLRPSTRLGAWFHERSNFYRALEALLVPDSKASLVASQVEQSEFKVRVPCEHRRALLGHILRECRDRDIHLTIIIPLYRVGFDRHENLLREFAAENGIPTVDLPRRLTRTPEWRAELFADPLHPNEMGHRHFAREIRSVVETEWECFAQR